MESFANSRQVASNLLDEIARIAESRGRQDLASDLRKEKTRLLSGELYALVCGEAKRGKSSLINGYLEVTGLCPVDAPVATNAITIVRFGKEERILVHFRDAETGEAMTQPVTREDLRQFVTEQGNPDNGLNVTLVEIWLQHPKLEGGLVLIDTPGIGSLNIDHAAVTYAMVPYADAVLFTGQADQPLTDPETAFTARIGKHTRRVLYVLTKRDRVGNYEERLREDVAIIEAAMELESGTMPGVAVSSELAAMALEDADEDLRKNSGFPELDRLLSTLIAEKEGIILSRTRLRLLAAIAELRLPLEAEKKGFEATSAAELKEIEDALAAKIARANELTGGTAFWVADLNTEVQKLQTDCARLLVDHFAALHRAVDNYVRVPEYTENPEKLGSMLTVDCSNAFASTMTAVEARLDEIAAALRQVTSLELDAGVAEVHSLAAIEIAAPGKVPQESFVKKVSNIGRSSVIHSMGLGSAGGFAGAMIGGIVGTFAGPVGTIGGAMMGAQLGASVGAFLGGIFGLKRGFSDLSERNLMTLRQNLAAEAHRHLEAAHRELSYGLANLLATARNDMHQNLLRQIRSEQKACEQASAALARAKQERQSDFSKRLRELANQLQMLQRLEDAARVLGEDMTAKRATTA